MLVVVVVVAPVLRPNLDLIWNRFPSPRRTPRSTNPQGLAHSLLAQKAPRPNTALVASVPCLPSLFQLVAPEANALALLLSFWLSSIC